MDDDVGAVFERLEKDRRGDRIVNDQRDAVSMRRPCELILSTRQRTGRIADGLAKNSLCIFVD